MYVPTCTSSYSRAADIPHLLYVPESGESREGGGIIKNAFGYTKKKREREKRLVNKRRRRRRRRRTEKEDCVL